MKRLMISMICAALTFVCAAQNNRAVNGAVYNDSGMPLPAATLKTVGTDLSFNVNPDGKFVIQIPYYVKYVEASLEGYISQTVEVDGSYMVFKLKVDKKYAEAKAKAEAEAKAAEKKAQEEKAKAEAARLKAEEDARVAAQKAEEDARIAAQKAEAAKAKAEENARIAAQKAEEDARIAAEREAARLAAEKEAAAKAEAKAQAKAEEDARIAAEREAARLAAEKEAEAKAAARAQAKAAEDARIAAEKEAKLLARNEKKAEKEAFTNNYNETYRNKGVINELEVGMDLPFHDIYLDYDDGSTGHAGYPLPVTLNYMLGYRFCNWFSLSLGAGFSYEVAGDIRKDADFFESCNGLKLEEYVGIDGSIGYENYDNFYVPVYLNAKAYLSKTKIQPMLSVSGGLYLYPKDLGRPDLLFNAGIGCNFRLSRRNNMYIMLTYGLTPNVSLFHREYPEGMETLKGTIYNARTISRYADNSIGIKVGFSL